MFGSKCGHHLRIGAQRELESFVILTPLMNLMLKLLPLMEENFYQYDEKLEKKLKQIAGINEGCGFVGIGEISGKKKSLFVLLKRRTKTSIPSDR